MDCPTHERHEIKCPTNINDFTLIDVQLLQGRGARAVFQLYPESSAQVDYLKLLF